MSVVPIRFDQQPGAWLINGRADASSSTTEARPTEAQGLQLSVIRRNVRSMASIEPDRSESKNAKAQVTSPMAVTVPSLGKGRIPSAFMPWTGKRDRDNTVVDSGTTGTGPGPLCIKTVSPLDLAQRKAGSRRSWVARERFIVAAPGKGGGHPSDRHGLIPMAQPYAVPEGPLARQTLVTTSTHWSNQLDFHSILEIEHLVLYCNGQPKQIFETHHRSVPFAHDALHVTIHTTPYTSSAELSHVLSCLPLSYHRLSIMGPTPSSLPVHIHARSVVFWNATDPVPINTWLARYSQNIHHVVIHFDPLLRDLVMPVDMGTVSRVQCSLCICHRESSYSMRRVYRTPNQDTTLLAPFRYEPDQRFLALYSTALTHQLMLSIVYADTLFPCPLRFLGLSLTPYAQDMASIQIWLQHMATLARTLYRIKSLQLDIWLRVDPDCLVWLPKVVQVLLDEVFPRHKSRNGRIVICPLETIDLRNDPHWREQLIRACPVTGRREKLQVVVFDVALELEFSSVIRYVNQFQSDDEEALPLMAQNPTALVVPPPPNAKSKTEVLSPSPSPSPNSKSSSYPEMEQDSDGGWW